MPGRSKNMAIADEQYKFSGKELDNETGYEYFGARYYDAALGRWLSVDPLDISPGLSPYQYSRDNPVSFLDPDGQEELRAMEYAQNNLLNKDYGIGLDYSGVKKNGTCWTVKYNDRMVCNELICRAYAAVGYEDFPAANYKQIQWSESHSWFTTNRNAGERGDVIYYQTSGDKNKVTGTHDVMITGVMIIDGVAKYTFVHAGSGTGTTYSVDNFLTADEIGEKYAGGKKFVGIESVKGIKLDISSTAPQDATYVNVPIDFKEWVNSSHTVYKTTNGELKFR